MKFRYYDQFNNTMHYSDHTSSLSSFFEMYELASEGDNNCTLMTSVQIENKLFYAGDVLNDDTGNIIEVCFGELPLDKSGDCVCTFQAFYGKDYGKLGQSPSHECTQLGTWMKVIGNKFQNPELIK